MLDVRSGLHLIHNGRQVELLYVTDKLLTSEIWKVRLSNGTIHSELFELGDTVQFTEGGARYQL